MMCMSIATKFRWQVIGRWSPTLVTIGGMLLVGHAVLLGLDAYTGLAVPPDVFGPTGHLVALAGVLVLYSVLEFRPSIVSRLWVVTVTAALLGWTVLALVRFLTLAGIVHATETVLPAGFVAPVFVATILAYLLVGFSFLLSGRRARATGLLALSPGVLIIVGVLHAATSGMTAHDAFVIGSGLALSMLAFGYRLRIWTQQSEQRTPAGTTTTG